METKRLIGMQVIHTGSKEIGIIVNISNSEVVVDFFGEIRRFPYPAAFAGTLELEDEDLQKEIHTESTNALFEKTKREYQHEINAEIEYLKKTGGKKYRIFDGERLQSTNEEYLYSFDTEMELNFPNETEIKLCFPENIIPAYVVSCEDFTLSIRTEENIGKKIDSVEFTSEQWHLLEALQERLSGMTPEIESLAYKIACTGRQQVDELQNIKYGQDSALDRATSEDITFIWGPPGTGKTQTLAKIALEHIMRGRRVLMLSYSNVSVDGALLRVAKIADLPEGTIIRYGHPKTKELLESGNLTSYQYVLHKNPDLEEKYRLLLDRMKQLPRKSPERLEVAKKVNRIRKDLKEQEKILVQHAAFVATTVSEAVVDNAIYTQLFDAVIFDEASMAYVPQIIFSAGLAKNYFVCLGDFCQLPAIVQNKEESQLAKDIFEYTGIVNAIENDRGHKWLVMLNQQYRMHRNIADFVSEYMYNGLLKTSDTITESSNEIAATHPCPGAAMSLMDLSGMYSVCIQTMDWSRINILSAMMCLRIAEKNINQNEIGIITPYSAQSRLMLAMVRDLQERDKRWQKVSCATVHQFQGAEKPIIIYDAVDCFRMRYPGQLLTSLNNNTANRLFNVALTRAKGKFILVANTDFMERKHISTQLIFTKAMKKIEEEEHSLYGDNFLAEMLSEEDEVPQVFVEDKEQSWKTFIKDIVNAKEKIYIDIPNVIDDSTIEIEELAYYLEEKEDEKIGICIRIQEGITLPVRLRRYAKTSRYAMTPITVIDKKISWFGQPLYTANFISEGKLLNTKYFPCVRFEGMHTAKLIREFLKM